MDSRVAELLGRVERLGLRGKWATGEGEGWEDVIAGWRETGRRWRKGRSEDDEGGKGGEGGGGEEVELAVGG